MNYEHYLNEWIDIFLPVCFWIVITGFISALLYTLWRIVPWVVISSLVFLFLMFLPPYFYYLLKK